MSSDRDQKSFDEYFGEMPWKALDFKDRSLKKKLGSAFDGKLNCDLNYFI